MRSIVIATATLAFSASTALADMNFSAMIGNDGLSQTEANLAAQPSLSPSDQFALGGVRFLTAVERALQLRYSVGMDPDYAEMSGLPFLRLPIAENPNPEPFHPAVIEELFIAALADLDGALSALDTITITGDVAVTIKTQDLWFHINANGTRESGEGLFEVAGGDLTGNQMNGADAPIVRFDTADAAWLSAYAHLLSGLSEAILAVDPTEAISRVLASGPAMDAFRGTRYNGFFTGDDAKWLDMATMFIHAIEGQPDVTRSRQAHAHFTDMIADNQVFWARVAHETDNKREWIPNAAQTSALPLPFPPETAERWSAVLGEIEAILQGDLLIPHWRVGQNAGLNLYELMQNPPEIDIIGIIQGETVLPYVERGQRADGQSIQAFQRLLGGDAAFYALILN